MNVANLRRIFITVLALVPFTVVHAAGPTVEKFHNEDTFVADCGTYLLEGSFVEDVRATTFFDKTGTPIKVEFHFNYVGTLKNLSSGRTFRDPGHYKVVLDLRNGTQSAIGMIFAITVPGEGVVVLDAGKVVFDSDFNIIFEAGPHQFLHDGPARVCAALE